MQPREVVTPPAGGLRPTRRDTCMKRRLVVLGASPTCSHVLWGHCGGFGMPLMAVLVPCVSSIRRRAAYRANRTARCARNACAAHRAAVA
eukprot:3959966-Prymnesium_polylepis.1